MACRAQAKPGRFAPHWEEAQQLLNDRDFFCDFAQTPSDVKWTSNTHLQFTSQLETPWPETKTVHAQFHRCSEDWQKKPTVVLVHGWNDELGYVYRQPVLARKLVKAGVNSAMLELPMHLHRRPRRPDAVNDFISEDVFATVLAAREAICDVRAFIAWLRAQGSPHIGVWGVSLGGWLSGLVACHDSNVDSLALMVPAAKMDLAVQQLEFCSLLKNALKNSSLDLGKLNLPRYRPKVAPEKTLIIEAEYDLFAAKEAIEETVAAWGCAIWRTPHAHISSVFSLPLMNRTVEWLSRTAMDGRCSVESHVKLPAT